MAITWLLLCMAVLLFAFVRRDMPNMSIAFTWLLILLTAPAGFLALVAAKVGVVEALGLASDPFISVLSLWAAAVLAGYFQWFMAVPWIMRSSVRHFDGVFGNHPRQIIIYVLAGASLLCLFSGLILAGVACLLLVGVVAMARGPRVTAAGLAVAVGIMVILVFLISVGGAFVHSR